MVLLRYLKGLLLEEGRELFLLAAEKKTYNNGFQLRAVLFIQNALSENQTVRGKTDDQIPSKSVPFPIQRQPVTWHCLLVFFPALSCNVSLQSACSSGTWDQPPSEIRKRFRHFLSKHQDNPKSYYGDDNNYCNNMMPRKGLRCQRRNTFIHATERQLRSICNRGGQIQNGITTSRDIFSITTCKRKRRGWFRRQCRYNGKSKTRKIRVFCRKGKPVRFLSHL
ncbi:ribonuclease-like 3 [Heteronotia binoei]|uniref:ribonuclease-like 3 n=1 Tax=Heteronotia binoei TaxID=13085 RepID=UPI00293072B6|nr:ribonuclease-like 3 [Heteronotia binoei]